MPEHTNTLNRQMRVLLADAAQEDTTMDDDVVIIVLAALARVPDGLALWGEYGDADISVDNDDALNVTIALDYYGIDYIEPYHSIRGKPISDENPGTYGRNHDMDCPACVASGSSFLASPRSDTYWSS